MLVDILFLIIRLVVVLFEFYVGEYLTVKYGII